jgi:hypothetical protein
MDYIHSLLNVLQMGLGVTVFFLWIWVLSDQANFYVPIISDFLPHSSLPLLLLTAILTVAFLLVWAIRDRVERNT